MLFRENVMHHSGKHDPVPTFSERVAVVKLEIIISKKQEHFSV